jgi:hypothetical protein
MAHGWTPERRKKQSQLIQKWKPWENSTGPRTTQGRAISSMNALKHGMRSKEMREMESGLADLAKIQRLFLDYED